MGSLKPAVRTVLGKGSDVRVSLNGKDWGLVSFEGSCCSLHMCFFYGERDMDTDKVSHAVEASFGQGDPVSFVFDDLTTMILITSWNTTDFHYRLRSPRKEKEH